MLKALILAAGVGARMGSDRHKALLPLARGETVLGRTLRQLQELSCEAVIVTGHESESLVWEFGKIAAILANPWYRERNSLYTLWWAAQQMTEEQFLVGYCDAVVSDSVLEALVQAEPETAAVVPGYNGRGVCPVLRGGFVVQTTKASMPDSKRVTFSGFSFRTRRELLKLSSRLDFLRASVSHSIEGCKAIMVEDGWAINVNTLADLEIARGMINWEKE